jgi:pimeloyl-ACP methyl ester carboxylesterase
MTETLHPSKHTVETPSGTIAYTELGSGPVALFVHGVLMNKHLWRHQLEGLADIRRSIAIDILAHGETEISSSQPVDVTSNAEMIAQFLDALKIDQVDLIGNDSGGGIAQIFAANHPNRIRSFTITNADTHDNWPPVAFQPFVDMSNSGGLSETLNAMLADKSLYRSANALGPAYEDAESVTDHDIDIYLQPFVKTEQRTHDMERFVAAFDNKHTLAIEDKIKQLHAPVHIIWGDDDVYFPVKWATWLAEEIPGASEPTVLHGARLFFPEERHEEFNDLLRTALTTPR